MTWQSRVPAVLDALVSIWSAAPGLGDIVQDGPIPLQGAGTEVLTVGYDGGQEGISVDGALEFASLCPEPQREAFTVVCLIAVLNGSGDVRAARVRAYELLSAASAAVTADITLGGVVIEAGVTSQSLRQLQADNGALVKLGFSIACDAFTAQ